MGFAKKDSAPEITIEVQHQFHPGTIFSFTLPKILPQAALNAEAEFVGLKDDERPEAYREALVGLVAELVTLPPTGFDDFKDVIAPSLAERMRAYFNDPAHPELESILVAVWRAYKAAVVPVAYTKSVQADSTSSSHLPGTTSKT